jgi:TolB-like protein/Tfp pilus assembly protein PilF
MAAPSELVGQILGHYLILDQIGAGGMGVVYRAHDSRLDRQVAIKVLPPGVLSDERARRQLRKEAIALAKVNHPNIATIYDFDTQGGIDFLVMEYVVGTTLADKLKSGPLPEKQIFAIGEQVAKALDCAHATSLVHRDLKPGNVMISPSGEVKLLDFGLSVLLKSGREAMQAETVTKVLNVVGTLPYMSPEQLRGDAVDCRADIYAVGVMLYEMATGQRPFDSHLSTGLIEEILHKPLVSPQVINPRTSLELTNVIVKCLERDPDNRYQSAKEIAVDMRRTATAGVVITVKKKPPPQRLWRTAIILGIAALALFGLLFMFRSGQWPGRVKVATAAVHINSLAVLPLENLSADPTQEYFADGMTDELISALAKIGTLRVISRTSVMQYKGVHKPLPQIAKELNVDGIIEGTVANFAQTNRVRITVQLVDAANDHNLWSQSYERDVGDVFVLQDEVARNIAQQIRVQLTPRDEVRLASSRAVNSEVLEAYLKGRYHWYKGTEEQLKQAKTYFERAAEIGPGYAPAYVGLADYYWATDELSPQEANPKARAYVLKALALDDTLADAHTTLGAIQFYADWDWSTPEKEFKRAIDLNPSHAEAHRMYSIFLSTLGRAEEAIVESEIAERLDPLALSPSVTAGWTFYYARQYDSAIAQCRKAMELDPQSISAHDCLGNAYLGKGAFDQGIAECELVASRSGNDPLRLAGLGRAYALAGKKSEAEEILRKLRAASRIHYVPPYLFGMVYAALDDKNQALSWLEKAFNEHDSYLTRLKVDQAMDPLRSEPRFAKLRDRMSL